jgi:Chemoreceptor zinc-binding domain
MGMLNWFGSVDGSNKEAEVQVASAPVEGMLSGLNMAQVLEAHRAWKARLQKVLDGTSEENFDIAVASEDFHCFLGKWIYSEGKSLYSHLPEYESLRQAHAEFHVCAGQVLQQHELGNQTFAEVILKTKFRTASNKNQMEITNLFRAAKV